MATKNQRRKAAAEAANASSFHIHMTDREGWYAILHARSGVFATEGHDEASHLAKMFEEMDLMDTYNLLVSGVGVAELERMSNDPVKFEVYELSPIAVNYFLEKFTKGKMLPEMALQLAPVIQRFKDAKMGAYQPPEAPPKALPPHAA